MTPLRSLLALLITALLVALAPTAAYAAPLAQTGGEAPGEQAGISCTDGVCQVSVDLETLGDNAPVAALQLASGVLRFAEKNMRVVPDGAALEVSERVTLALPIGEIEMFNADLDVERSEEGEIERFYGTAAVPLPTLGIFEELQLVAPGKALVAYDTGAALDGLGVELDPERRYLALHFGSGNESALNDPSFSFTGGEGQNSLLLVVDPVERFVHVVGNVMLVDTAQLLLADQLGGLDAAGMTAGLLPLPEKIGLRLALLVTDDWNDTQFDLSGGYAVSGGPLAARFGLDVEPIAFEGTLGLSDEGVALVGKARSVLEPDEVFAGEGSAAIQIPLLGSGELASLDLAANVNVPMFSLSEGGDVTLVVPEIAADELLASARTQIEDSSRSMRDGVEWIGITTTDRMGDGSGVREGVEWIAVTAADSIGEASSDVGNSAVVITQESRRWVTEFVGDAAEFATENADVGVAAVNNMLCSRFGRCGTAATAAAD